MLTWISPCGLNSHTLIDPYANFPHAFAKIKIEYGKDGKLTKLDIARSSPSGQQIWTGCIDRCPYTSVEDVKEWAKRTYLMEFV